MKRKLYISFLFIIIVALGYGQQDVTFSQYTFDKMLINPAYAGSSKWLVGSVKNRTQFSTIEGVPQSNILTFQAPIQIKNIGVGVKILQDKIGVTNNFVGTAQFSYHIGFGKGKLSFGLEGGVINSNYNYDPLIKVNNETADPAIPIGYQSIILPDFATGIFYNHEKFYVGGSVQHLVNFKKTIPGFNHNAYYFQDMNYYMTAGYYFEIKRDYILEPSMVVKYVYGVLPQADVNLMFTVIDKFSAGISYRSFDAVMAMLKFDITKNLKIMYSFDYTISPLSNYFRGGCHEIGISYGIELLPPPVEKVIHPRYYF